MRTVRIFFHSILLLAILSTGLPLYHPSDMNRDGRIGLSDAIISVRELARTATSESAFRDGMENTLISLSVAAGLTNMIRTERDPGSGPGRTVLSAFLIAPPYQCEVLSAAVPYAADRSPFYNSPLFSPVKPPPRTGLT